MRLQVRARPHRQVATGRSRGLLKASPERRPANAGRSRSPEGRSFTFMGIMQASRDSSFAADEKALEEVLLTRLLRLNATVQGVVTGIVTGLGIFIATNWLVLKGGEVVGPHLALLGQFFIGYRVTFVGSLIGFAYGFISGFLGGYCVSRIYNWLGDAMERKR